MKNSIYLLISVLCICIFTSCSDDDEFQPELREWKYKAAHMEMEYTEDTISMGMPGNAIRMTPDEFADMIQDIAHKKMKQHFAGLDFISFDTLTVKAVMSDGSPMQVNAGYKMDGQFLKVDLSALSAQIPPISLHYRTEDRQMIMYIDQVYLQAMFNMEALQEKLVDMLVHKFNPNFDRMTPEAQKGMKTGVKMQLAGILAKITRLEFGFVLE